MTYAEFAAAIAADSATIAAQAQEGNKKAQGVIELYKLHYAAPNDPAALGFLKAGYSEWKKDQA